MNQDNNFVTNAAGVRLKKVKRPKRREQPEMPYSTRPKNMSRQNPFDDGQSDPSDGLDNFDLDDYLDGAENLPSLSDNGNNQQKQPYQPQFIDENSFDYNGQENMPSNNQMISKKLAAILIGAALLLGIILANLFISEKKVVRDGLQGVVINAEVPRGRARCGIAEKTQGCVLYLMNPQRQELNARDFYDLASQLTGRQRFVIETGNMRYSSTKIRPGEIGQFNIPPLQ